MADQPATWHDIGIFKENINVEELINEYYYLTICIAPFTQEMLLKMLLTNRYMIKPVIENAGLIK